MSGLAGGRRVRIGCACLPRLQPLREHCLQLGQHKGLGEIVVHSGGKTASAIAFHRIGRERSIGSG